MRALLLSKKQGEGVGVVSRNLMVLVENKGANTNSVRSVSRNSVKCLWNPINEHQITGFSMVVPESFLLYVEASNNL